MGHHGTPFYDEESLKKLEETFLKQKAKFPDLPEGIGATGNFPDGTINATDQGELAFGVLVQEGRVVFHFGEKPIQWIGFSKEEIISLRDYLNEKIKQLP